MPETNSWNRNMSCFDIETYKSMILGYLLFNHDDVSSFGGTSITAADALSLKYHQTS